MWKTFDPGSEGVIEFDGENPTVACAELLVVRGSLCSGGAEQYSLDRRGPSDRGVPRGSFANGNFCAWQVDTRLLWRVDHLVSASEDRSEAWVRGSKVAWGKVKELIYHFDYKAANSEIARAAAGRRALVGTSDLLGLRLAEGGTSAAADSAEDALRAARVSAAEAAGARVRPAHVIPARLEASGGMEKPKVRFFCRYSQQVCEGCTGLLGFGKLCQPGGRSMVHPNERCLQLAEHKLMSEVSSKGRAPASGTEGCPTHQDLPEALSRQEALAKHRLGPERKERVLLCLEGRCKESDEPRLMCRKGCGRGLHAAACGSFSKGVIALGNLVCPFCTAAGMLVDGSEPPRSLVEAAVGASIIEMTTGASQTQTGYSDLVALERRWQETVCGTELAASQVKLPHTCLESTISFLEWACVSGTRARSLGSLVTMLSSYCVKLEIVDHTRSKRVKKVVADLVEKHGAESSPCTHMTATRCRVMLEVTIPAVCGKVAALQEYFVARESFLQVAEFVGGARVGEVTGEIHGVVANNACIQRRLEGRGSELGETIEMKIDNSKTKLGRHIVFMGVTSGSALDCAARLRALWKESGIAVVHSANDGGFESWRPDYWVVRVGLLGMTPDLFKRFLAFMLSTAEPVLIELARNVVARAKSRRNAQTLGDEHRYVNVAGGRLHGPEVVQADAVLKRAGFGPHVSVCPGPLVRATNGATRLTHMPYSTESTHVHLLPAMRAADEAVTQMGLEDPDFDLRGLKVAAWGNHSNRRGADGTALRTMAITGATETDLNYFFGWKLKEMEKEMIKHYAGMDRLSRLLNLARVTMMV